MATTTAGSGLQINFTYQQDPSTLPSGFVAALNYAAQQIESIITSPVTVDISVFYGITAPSNLGVSDGSLEEFSYTEVKNALANVDPTAAAHMPASDPVAGSSTLWVGSAEAAVLGLTDPIYVAGSGIDGTIGFNQNMTFTYDPNARAVPGAYDFIGVAEHEITEVLGRISLFGNEGISDQGSVYTLLDMFHYTSPGVNTYTGTQPNYFSPDGGNTEYMYFNTSPGVDLGDWAGGNDVFAAFMPADTQLSISQADIAELNTLGYQTVSANGVSPSGTNSFAIEGGAVVGLGSVAIGDQTSNAISSATVTIADAHGNPVAGDELFVNGIQDGNAAAGITASWNASTNTLTLSGAASLQTYDTLLSDVTYQDTGTDPSTGSHPERTVTWTVNDGTQNLTGTSQIAIDRAPVEMPITASASLAVGANVSAASLFDPATDADGDTILFYILGDSDTSVGQWHLNGQPISGQVSASDLSQLTYQALSAGTDNASLQADDGHTLSSAQGDDVIITVTASGGGGTIGETLTANDTAGQHLTGTPYDDTFYAGHNSVVMTGNGGDDTFVFQYEPWNAGSITDFNTSADTLDLSALLSAAGYTGSNPVADGYLQFTDDGKGDTQVYLNSHVSGSYPNLITTLDHVSPSSITPADYGYGSNSGGGNGATLTTLAGFDGTNGTRPDGVTMDNAGNLFGATETGGGAGGGTIFEIAKTADGYAGTPTTLASFDGTNGASPDGGFIIDSASDIIGSAAAGGANNDGTIFELVKTANGYSEPTILTNFDGTNGSEPQGHLITDANGDIFGTTYLGGEPNNDSGTVFELAKSGDGYASLSTVSESFASKGGNGDPYPGLAMDAAGDLFGVTGNGETVFEIAKTASGYSAVLTTIESHSLEGIPSGFLVVDSAGNLYGTTTTGGAGGEGTLFEIAYNGSSYASTPTVLANFDGTGVGGAPTGILEMDGAGNIFGTTNSGDADGYGGLFELAKTGTGYSNTPLNLYAFQNPGSTLSHATDSAGDLFGTSTGGGANSDGTVFEITNTGFVPTSSGGGGTTGETLTANDTAGQHLTGTPNDDIFYAGHNSVVMTGDGGADTFVFQYEPWNAGSITDFTPGNDKLDLSALLTAAGYSGNDPVADGYVTFASDGSGDTNVYFNPHDASQSWPSLITTLDGIAPTGLTAANTLGTAGSGGGGTGGGTTGETLTANDTAGQQLTGTPNDDTFYAGHNSVVMTGDGGADQFVFQYAPWNAGSITDFNTAADVLNLKGIFAAIGYTGGNPVADGYLAFNSDGQGDTQVIVNPQGPATQIPITVTTLDHVDPSAIHSGDYIFA
ncbi:MAG TPA: NF038122 family metalloprotease [Stellaceae bacterium]|jgi:uncharacterized repeat protein (TIGR03803 family)|nr:NF038122 family metalloprotease [Stellaceae bacterium]